MSLSHSTTTTTTTSRRSALPPLLLPQTLQQTVRCSTVAAISPPRHSHHQHRQQQQQQQQQQRQQRFFLVSSSTSCPQRIVLTSLLLFVISSCCCLSITTAFTFSKLPRRPFVSLRPETAIIQHRQRQYLYQQQQCLKPRIKKVLFSSSSPGSNTDEADDEEQEWQAILAALKMYKAAYGDLKVPQRFIVPNMAPWPECSWGLRLGKDVANIRATEKYLQGEEATRNDRRQALEDLGFLWRQQQQQRQQQTTTRAPATPEQVPLEQLYDALQAYRDIVVPEQEKQAWSVPPNFIVPDEQSVFNDECWPDSVRGMPLGMQLGNIKRRLARSKDTKARFQQLGLAMLADKPKKKHSATDIRFQNVRRALETYKKLYGDLLVPQPFTVPSDSPESDDWPEETWGLKLGARVNAIRSQGTFVNTNPERRQILDELGFVWNPPMEGRRGRKTRPPDTSTTLPPSTATTTTKEAPALLSDQRPEEEPTAESVGPMDSLFEGSFDFGTDFDFSQVGEKTTPTWGLEGGRALQEASRAAEQAAAQAEEEYAPPRTLEDSLQEASERALETGVIEGITENNRVIKGKREPDIPLFNDDFGDDFVFEDVVEALTIYKSIYGDFSNLTDSDFVVPAPEEVTGFLVDEDDSFEQFDADASARAAAAIARFEQEGDLESSEDLIAAEIKRLQEEVGEPSTATETEAAVVIEKSTTEWPEHLAGMGLGGIVSRIRDGSLEVKHLPERKAQLDAIDFDWGDPKYFIDVPFEKAMCAMYAYYLVRGDMFVYEDFVMPDEDPWPQALAGYEIGKAVKRIRELQNFLEAYHPEKVSLLRMIDFMWFPTTALPLDPNEPEMNTEYLLLTGMGHPDYAEMIDIPMGLPDKIIADGPFYETDNPKLWWRTWHNWDYVKDYWYQQGRRDNAWALRKMGYPQMAAEHEAKYGPGLFTQINETLMEIEKGIENKTLDEKRELLEKLNFYRQEMLNCTDILPEELEKLIMEFDTYMIDIMEDSNLEFPTEDELEGPELKEDTGEDFSEDYKEDEVGEEDLDEDDADAEDVEIDLEADAEDVEIDLEDELGLGIEK